MREKKLGSSQADRFKDAARKAGADESDDALDRAFGALELKHKPEPKDKSKASEEK